MYSSCIFHVYTVQGFSFNASFVPVPDRCVVCTWFLSQLEFCPCVPVPDLVRIRFLSNWGFSLDASFVQLCLCPISWYVCTRFLSLLGVPVFELVGNGFLSNRSHVPSKISQSVAIGWSVQNRKTLGMTVLPTQIRLLEGW